MSCRVKECSGGFVMVDGLAYHCVCEKGEKLRAHYAAKVPPIKLLPLPGYLRPPAPRENRVGREAAAGKDE
jgi:hypothetical protein